MKQSDLGALLSVSRGTISNYELEVRMLDPETIRQLCEIFGVTADYLLGFSSVRVSALPEEDYALAAAYHAAPPSVRAGIDALLAPYREEAAGAAG